MTHPAVEQVMAEALALREQQQRQRNLQVLQPVSAREVHDGTRHYLNFSSNDYLGLSHHAQVLGAFQQARLTGSRGSPLVTGYTDAHHYLTAQLAELLGREKVVLFSSAFAANHGVLATVGKFYRQLWLDRLAHASLLQGAQQRNIRWRRFAHQKFHLCAEAITQTEAPQLLVTESVFSMDGDALDTNGLQHMLDQHPQLDAMIDDAHGFGVMGAHGLSIAEQFEQRDVGILSLAFGKACGVAGGAIATDANLAEFLINFCPEYIYSTAMPPAQAAAISAAVKVIVSAEGHQLRQRLSENVALFRSLCRQLGLPVRGGEQAIQTLIVGEDAHALQLSDELRQQGCWCSAIRPPTVPDGMARLRITLTAMHQRQDIAALVNALARAWQESL